MRAQDAMHGKVRHRSGGRLTALATLCGLFVCFVSPANAQQIYMHRNADGTIVFSDAPTESGFEQHEPPGRGPSTSGSPLGNNPDAHKPMRPALDPQQLEEKRRAEQQAAVAAQVQRAIENLTAPSLGTRWNAARELEGLGSQARPALPALLRAANDPNESMRSAAIVALGRIAPSEPSVIHASVEALHDPANLVRENAATQLHEIGAPAVPAVLQALAEHAPQMDTTAHRVLADADLRWVDAALVDRAVAALLRLLDDPEAMTRSHAAASLGVFRVRARIVVPALTKALSDKAAWVRIGAANALGEIGRDAAVAVPALAKAIHDQFEVSRSVRAALPRIGTAEATAVLDQFEEENKPHPR